MRYGTGLGLGGVIGTRGISSTGLKVARPSTIAHFQKTRKVCSRARRVSLDQCVLDARKVSKAERSKENGSTPAALAKFSKRSRKVRIVSSRLPTAEQYWRKLSIGSLHSTGTGRARGSSNSHLRDVATYLHRTDKPYAVVRYRSPLIRISTIVEVQRGPPQRTPLHYDTPLGDPKVSCLRWLSTIESASHKTCSPLRSQIKPSSRSLGIDSRSEGRGFESLGAHQEKHPVAQRRGVFVFLPRVCLRPHPSLRQPLSHCFALPKLPLPTQDLLRSCSPVQAEKPTQKLSLNCDSRLEESGKRNGRAEKAGQGRA